MLPIVRRFDDYLRDTTLLHIKLHGFQHDSLTGDTDAIEKNLEFLHRWTPTYGKSRMAKLYLLAEHYRENPPSHITMITYTGEHDSPRYLYKKGHGHMAWLPLLRAARLKSRKIIREHCGQMPYLDIWEGHPSSGFAHIHSLYFGEVTEEQADKIARHWHRLGMGNREHGVKVDSRQPMEFKDIRSFIGYPMAYLAPSLIDTLQEWTAADVVFNASIYATEPRIRTFQPSQDLSRIMAWKGSTRAGYTHHETIIEGDAPSSLIEKVLYRSPLHARNTAAWDALFIGTV